MNYIVYQAYGNKDVLNELIYSIASIYKHKRDNCFKIIIYTDNQTYLEKFLPFDLIYENIDDRIIKTWRGEIDFVHRVKIMMLKDLCKKVTGNILYLDTDTVFTASPTSLFQSIENGYFVMHSMEGLISDNHPLFKKIFRKIKGQSFVVADGTVSITAKQEMWNAGVLGFMSDKKNLLDLVLQLTDKLYQYYPKHIMEQLAFSYVFSLQNKMVSCNDVIFHYWNFKEFRATLAQFLTVENSFENSFEKILQNYSLILPYKLILPKMEFEKKPKLIQQFLKHILKKDWNSFK